MEGVLMELTKEQYDWLDSVVLPLDWKNRILPRYSPGFGPLKGLYAEGYNLDVDRDGGASLWGTYGCNYGNGSFSSEELAKSSARKHQLNEIARVMDLDKAMGVKS